MSGRLRGAHPPTAAPNGLPAGWPRRTWRDQLANVLTGPTVLRPAFWALRRFAPVPGSAARSLCPVTPTWWTYCVATRTSPSRRSTVDVWRAGAAASSSRWIGVRTSTGRTVPFAARPATRTCPASENDRGGQGRRSARRGSAARAHRRGRRLRPRRRGGDRGRLFRRAGPGRGDDDALDEGPLRRGVHRRRASGEAGRHHHGLGAEALHGGPHRQPTGRGAGGFARPRRCSQPPGRRRQQRWLAR